MGLSKARFDRHGQKRKGGAYRVGKERQWDDVREDDNSNKQAVELNALVSPYFIVCCAEQT